ncbi:uncharacterized protein BO66DRAFT_441236 [Aspergillus aculeatinus CBS 121060]|uniref:Uncharacterized protein n=1 Tax=Aspergillus aculeatinus CBS 121060 TaxID=1448322 RepID=A0ACD1H103_9EURO|nr:hypothetical protein BO66DRAFT_441236 [Aspergillus aculeatinus CBS 121060]RAH67275.1 hypothetical protein BO66DRAFT_441236 [Aspergillus aculeatinus CBS 121060]
MSLEPETQSPHIFGLWSAIGLGWLTLNVFGTLSFIIVVGLPAGGVPVILYGLYIQSHLASRREFGAVSFFASDRHVDSIGSNIAVICMVMTFAHAVTMSRQGSAFARDGGLFWNAQLAKRCLNSNLPFWSITLPSLICALVGLIYLLSSSAYNAFVGSQVTCMIIKFGMASALKPLATYEGR